MPYLIDGHNLIPKAGLHLDSPDDEIDLVRLLQEFARLTRRQVEVYFDGAPPGHAGSRRFGRVTAHFVRRGHTADAAIKNRLDALAAGARNWTVVSSDGEVRGAADAAHAEIVSSEEFAALLTDVASEERHSGSPAKTAGESRLSPQEVEEWMEAFRKRR
jgi:hypothetical protein